MWFDRLRRFILSLNTWLSVLGMGTLCAIALLVTVDILGREIFGSPVTGSFEMSHYFGAYSIFLCLGFTTMSGRQLIIDFINFRNIWVTILDAIGLLTGIFIIFIAFWGSINMTLYSVKIGNLIPRVYIPLSVIYIILVIGFLLLLIGLVIEFIAIVKVLMKQFRSSETINTKG